MVKITDKDYYMDGYLKSACDFMAERERKKWDNLIIFDGDPGVGKSTIAIQVAYYMAYSMEKKFDATNVFFDSEDLIEFASTSTNQIILWDEAAFEGMGVDWQNKNQKNLVKLLYTARKYGHFLIFIIPEIHKLQYVFAGKRSLALIRVYSADNISRGRFKLYNKTRKIQLYLAEKRQIFNHGIRPNFWGAFTNNKTSLLINMDEYDKKKDAAIKRIGEQQNDRSENIIKNLVGGQLKYGYTDDQMGELLSMSTRSWQRKKRMYRKEFTTSNDNDNTYQLAKKEEDK